ncbi:unnamed protein product [Mytilus edulis]|uniref:Uncharacterized protein n=1 Tax=Mytilus edulis TaxID=6550 RepID=A0A8S3UML6_MYTED|nr:unnamed protein product [Mytilus edulis]
MLSELAFSGRHAEQSVWVISQRYNSVLKDLREQTKWLCMFYTKDRDSFDNCLRENDVIPTLEERQRIKEELKKKKHRKLILKTDQPTDYCERSERFPSRKKTRKIISVVAGGSSKQYLGKELQLSDIDKMTTEQINKLYCKYEARLGASMTKTLGNSFINLYVMGVSKFFKVVNPPILIQDLEEDPFINNALTNTCCELYYRYGMYLAPFTAILTTARHIEPLASLDFRKKDENNDIKNDE